MSAMEPQDDITQDPDFQREQHALAEKHTRSRQLACLKESAGRRKTGEINKLFSLATALHNTLCLYDVQAEPTAEMYETCKLSYPATIARLEACIAANQK